MRPGIEMNGGALPRSPSARASEKPDNFGGLGSATWVSPETIIRPRPKAARRAAISLTRRFRTPPHRVFDAWLDPEVAGKWLFATASHPMAHVEIDARVGGSFRFVDQRDGEMTEHTGKYVEIVPHRRLAFSLSLEKRPLVITRVMVEIVPVKKGCALTLTHANLPPDDANRTKGRWTGILYGLEVNLDSGFTELHDDQE